jgi:uroporphyrinogen-III synthase
MPDNGLDGLKVLVTRPSEQAQNLVKLIEQHAGNPVLLPMLKIEPVQPDESSLHLLQQLTGKELLIFISANAVRYAHQYVPQAIRHELTIAAIGRGTANELARAGLQVNLLPDTSHDSEALLALPQLSDIKGRHVVIVRGQGGREKLAETLRARGANVDYAEVYRRVAPDVKIEEHLSPAGIDIISITSGEALTNLAELARAQQQSWVFEKPLVVFHNRIAQQAKELGFGKTVLVVKEMSDAGIVHSLVQMNNTGA